MTTTQRPTRFCENILIFDTETTGLIPKVDPITKQRPPYTEYPHITQLTLAVYHARSKSLIYVYNKYIKVPENVVIEPIITELTGVTRELLDTQGVDIKEALTEFYQAYMRCDTIVAHNIEFDRDMINLEFGRLSGTIEQFCPSYGCVFNSVYEQMNGKEIYCTMKSGRNVCNIMVDYKKKTATNTIIVDTATAAPSNYNLLTMDMSANDINALVAGLQIPTTQLPATQLPATQMPSMAVIEERVDAIVKKSTATQYKKMPKLIELYTHLFGEVPTGLHNSLADTMVCMRCFLKMRLKQEMSAEYINMYIRN